VVDRHVRSKGALVLWLLIAVLFGFNVLLLCCVVGLRRSVQLLSATARTAETTSALRGRVREPEQTAARNSAPEVNRSPALDSGSANTADSNNEIMLDRLVSRPNVHEIPILDEASLQELLARRDQIQPASYEALLKGDVDSLLQSDWNPSGRDLDAQARTTLGVLLNDYRFFARISRQERIKTDILPLVSFGSG